MLGGVAEASLAGILAKLDRAKTHAETFDRRFTEFLQREPYSVTIQSDGEPAHTVHFHWQVKEAPPLDLALILGDLLTNLRATLDYLVWQLVLAVEGTPTDRNAFPCVRQAKNWHSAREDRLAGVDPHWAEEIEKLQPYHRTQQPERHPLAVLDTINNINKHRALPPIVMTLPTWTFRLGGDIGGRSIKLDQWLDRPIEDGVEFMRYSFDPPLDKAELHLDTDPPFRVAFRDGMDHSDGWSYTNADLVDWVETAVAIFKPALPS
jgi:hypothetical protein